MCWPMAKPRVALASIAVEFVPGMEGQRFMQLTQKVLPG